MFALNARKRRTVLVRVILAAQLELVNRMPILTIRPSLPMPVKLKPLAKFLSGYWPDVLKYIISIFHKVLPYIFKGNNNFVHPKIYPLCYKIPNMSTRNWHNSWQPIKSPVHSCLRHFISCVSPLDVIPKKIPHSSFVLSDRNFDQ